MIPPSGARPAPASTRRGASATPPSAPARSSRRTVALIAGAAAVVAVIAIAVLVLGSSSSPSKPAPVIVSTVANGGSGSSGTHHKVAHKNTPAKAPAAAAVSPAETTVAVLNGTETTGLAHRISSVLQQGGYAQATPLDGRPPGSGQVTVVEYASGHQAEAEGVAHSLSVAQVQPLESAVSALAGSASVVVIVGADKAASVP